MRDDIERDMREDLGSLPADLFGSDGVIRIAEIARRLVEQGWTKPESTS